MGLINHFAKELRKHHQLHAVVPPGANRVDLGDILIRKDGIYSPIGNIRNWGIRIKRETGKGVKLKFQSKGASTTAFQAGVEVPLSKLKKAANAELELSFNKGKSVFVRTSQMKGTQIGNLLAIGKKIKEMDQWEHGEYFIASTVYHAKGFAVLVSRNKNSKINFSGKGGAVLSFLTLGLSAGLKRTGSSSAVVDFSSKETAPIAMKIVRVDKKGKIKIIK